ncbi:MAG: AbrB family transcriptional regulator [Pseudomonadota bacterium]
MGVVDGPQMTHLTTIILIALGTLAGLGADWLGLPLPYMIGPLLTVGAVALTLPHVLPEGYSFPARLRLVFIAVIGLIIGAQVTPELFANASGLAISFAALMIFVAICQGFNYWVFRRLGGYDKPTAFYAGSPGGLFESLAMGEEAGGDVARLTLQQFLRIVIVVTALPIGLSLYLGEPVGSAAGISFSSQDVPWTDLPIVALAGALGLLLGRILRLPAQQITGPMLMAAALALSGFFQIDMPDWLIKLAQIIVGTALGMRFTGLSRALVLRGIGLSLLSVGGMLVVSAGFATALVPLTGQPFDVLLISFAPGGVTEMSLVALSLQANPAFVTLHHIIRILITVAGLILTARLFRRPL